jgi:hypothetical protein
MNWGKMKMYKNKPFKTEIDEIFIIWGDGVGVGVNFFDGRLF